jgi:hypothetical protein
VSLIMMAKFNHVATVVAGIDLLVKALSLLRLHCCHQWNEDFECSFQQNSKLWQTLAKTVLQDSIKPGLNRFLQSET